MNCRPRQIVKPRRLGRVFFAPLVFASGALAAFSGLQAQNAAQSERGFRVYSRQGKEYVGAIEDIEADWSVRMTAPRGAEIAGKDFYSLRRWGALLPPPPTGRHVVFSNGDRIAIAEAGRFYIERERLHFRPQAPLRVRPGPQANVPLPFVEFLFLRPPRGTLATERFVNGFLDQSRSGDVVVMTNGDRISGTLTHLDSANSCRLKSAGKTIEVPTSRIAAVAFSTQLLVRRRPASRHGRGVFSNGARLTFSAVKLEADRATISGKTLFGSVLESPLGGLYGLEIRDKDIVFLSDLEPAKYEQAPFFGISWPLGRDREVNGGNLRLYGFGAVDKGLGMHGGAKVTYKLDRQYRWFECLAGVDPQTGNKGRLRAQVVVDGKCVATQEEMTAKTPPWRIRIDVGKADTMSLAVTGGARGNVQARFSWAGARLIKR